MSWSARRRAGRVRAFLAVALLGLSPLAVAAPIAGTTRQLVVVTSEGWTSSSGRLQRWERTAGGRWRAVGGAVAVVLGHAGLGWGAGDDDAADRTAGDPEKVEGDGRAPAGIFAFDGGFGEGRPPDGLRLSFRAPGERWLCVDDPAAPDYNQLVEAAVARPHRSAERLRSTDGQYVLGLVVAHNRAPVRPGKGSCIFLHVWAAPGTPTVGCTAMARAELERLVAWLDPAAGPRLVQLPRAVYRERKKAWGLP